MKLKVELAESFPKFAQELLCVRPILKPQHKVIGKSDDALFSADYAEAYRKGDAEVIETGKPQSEDFEIVRGEGKLCFHVTKTAVLDESGKCIGVLCSVTDITQHKRSEEDLRKSEAFQRTLSETSPDFIFALNADGTIQKANRLYPGLEKEEIVGQKASKFIPPKDRDAFEKAFRQALDTGQLQSLETMVDLPEGRHYFLNRLNPIRLTEEERSVVLINTDITERKQAEEKLKRRTHDLVKRVKELGCLYRIDEIGRKEGVTIMELLNGTTALIPQSWQHPEITEGRIIFEKNEFKTKTFKKTKWRQTADIIIDQRKAGSIEVYYTKAMPEEDEGPFLKEERDLIDSMASRLSGIIQRNRADEALKEERWRLESILKGTNIGTWEWNVQSGETIFNRRWAEILGCTLEEISPASRETWTKFVEPDDLKEGNEMLEKHFKGEREYYEHECRMKHKDGYWIWVLDKGKVFSWTEDGKPLMMFGTHQDITEQKRMELALRESEERFQQLSEIDELTGLLNRRGWNESIAAEENRALRYGQKPCVIILDLDGIKEINDKYGQKERKNAFYHIFEGLTGDGCKDKEHVAEGRCAYAYR